MGLGTRDKSRKCKRRWPHKTQTLMGLTGGKGPGEIVLLGRREREAQPVLTSALDRGEDGHENS